MTIPFLRYLSAIGQRCQEKNARFLRAALLKLLLLCGPSAVLMQSALPVQATPTPIPSTPFERYEGSVDYTVISKSLTTPTAPCTVAASASSTLTIPAGTTVKKAYLYWTGSGTNPGATSTNTGSATGGIDNQVTFKNPLGTTTNVTAIKTWEDQGSFSLSGTTYKTYYYGARADVTSLITGSGSYTIGGINSNPANSIGPTTYCAATAHTAGWVLIVIYDKPAAPYKTVALYEGFQILGPGGLPTTSTVNLTGFTAANAPSGGVVANTTPLVWQGDNSLTGDTLKINGTQFSDNNVFNSSGTNAAAGSEFAVDADILDIKPYVSAGNTSLSLNFGTSGNDLIIAQAAVLSSTSLPTVGSITGKVINDANNNGTVDAGETGFSPAVTVTLQDSSGNAVSGVAPVTTAADGSYTFNNVPPGTGYKVVVTPPASTAETLDPDATKDNQTTGVNVTAGSTTTVNSFAYAVVGSITGKVINDANNNGVVDAAETGFSPAVTVTLKDSSNNTVATTTTAANGSYTFNNVLVGTGYKVVVTPPASTTETLDPDATKDNQTTGVNVTAGSTATVNSFAYAVTVPDLTIAGTHTGSFIRGSTGTYTLNVTNLGNAATSGTVTVSDTLPTGLTPTAASGTGWNCSISGQSVTCTRLDALNSNQSYSPIAIAVAVAQNAAASLTNTATVSGGGETNTTNDTANDPTTIVSSADLAIAVGAPNTAIVGNNLTYTVTVTNNGASNATGVVITDPLPLGVTYVLATPSQGSCNQSSGTVTCNLGNLASSNTATINIVVLPTTAGQLTNTASVTGNEPDPATANNTAVATTTIATAPTPPRLRLVKRITAINGTPIASVVDPTTTSDPNDDNSLNWPSGYLQGAINGGLVKPGDVVEYTIYFLSDGGSNASNVKICDLVPAYTTFIPDAFNGLAPTDGGLPADSGIALAVGSTNPTAYLTDVADAPDRGQFFPPGTSAPAACNTASFTTPLPASSNVSGAVVVDVTNGAATLSSAGAPGVPSNSYGFVRFRVRVK